MMHSQPVFQITRRKAQGSRLKGNAQNKKIESWHGFVGGEVAEDLFNRGLCLPSGTAMTEEDLDRVVDVIRKIGAGRRAQGVRGT
jgi:hypothetical protein